MKLLPDLALIALLISGQWAFAGNYTLAINHGRVIDPETGLDAVRHLGIPGSEIIAISAVPVEGSQVIVAGQPLIRDGKQVEGSYPGERLLSTAD